MAARSGPTARRAVGESAARRDVTESFLIQQGFMVRTARPHGHLLRLPALGLKPERATSMPLFEDPR
jgi:hypothetical protein